MSAKLTHKARLIRLMLERGEITASQVTGISNPNVYFVELERAGICQHREGTLGNARVRWRSIKDINKAKAFLAQQKAPNPTPQQGR